MSGGEVAEGALCKPFRHFEFADLMCSIKVGAMCRVVRGEDFIKLRNCRPPRRRRRQSRSSDQSSEHQPSHHEPPGLLRLLCMKRRLERPRWLKFSGRKSLLFDVGRNERRERQEDLHKNFTHCRQQSTIGM